MTAPIHATVVALSVGAGWRAALLRGPSGAGKSDLAARLIGRGWRLVADDYAHVWASGGSLYACAPRAIAGAIEVRSLGIVEASPLPLARVWLVVDCVQKAVERMPEPAREVLAGVSAPRLAIDIRPASAPDTLRTAMERL